MNRKPDRLKDWPLPLSPHTAAPPCAASARRLAMKFKTKSVRSCHLFLSSVSCAPIRARVWNLLWRAVHRAPTHGNLVCCGTDCRCHTEFPCRNCTRASGVMKWESVFQLPWHAQRVSTWDYTWGNSSPQALRVQLPSPRQHCRLVAICLSTHAWGPRLCIERTRHMLASSAQAQSQAQAFGGGTL